MHHAFKLGDAEHNLELSRSSDAYVLHLADRSVRFQLLPGVNGQARLVLGTETFDVVLATHGDDVFVHLGGEAYQLRYQHPLMRLAALSQGAAEDRIAAPMPGSVVAVSAAAGDAVSKGQMLLVMESMKMETTITAPRDGVIEAIHFAVGQTFDRDAVLISLAAGEQK